jgi:hypothetical protein
MVRGMLFSILMFVIGACAGAFCFGSRSGVETDIGSCRSGVEDEALHDTTSKGAPNPRPRPAPYASSQRRARGMPPKRRRIGTLDEDALGDHGDASVDKHEEALRVTLQAVNASVRGVFQGISAQRAQLLADATAEAEAITRKAREERAALEAEKATMVRLYKLNPVVTHSLKAPGCLVSWKLQSSKSENPVSRVAFKFNL